MENILGQAIGIDFGTTNTVVTYKTKRNNYRQLDYNGETLIPSVIHFNTKDNYDIGYIAKNHRLTDPKSCIDNFKTDLGEERSFSYKITAGNGDEFNLTPKRATKLFLNRVIRDMQEKLFDDFGIEDGIIDRAVITVPATFQPNEIQAIKEAASESLNLDDEKVRAIYEPSAAAIAVHYNEGGSVNKVLIYDLGGGTFDVSLIERNNENGKYRPVGTPSGDPKLGGNLLTDMLAENLMRWTNEQLGLQPKFTLNLRNYNSTFTVTKDQYEKNIIAIRISAEKVKEDLSDSLSTFAMFDFWTSENHCEQMKIPVKRRELEKIIKPVIEKTVDLTYKKIESEEAKAIGKIDKIVLAGGSSKIPLIQQLLSEKLNRDDIFCDPEVGTLISRGAAILAQDISKIDDVEQVMSFEIGVAATEGMQIDKFKKIIPANIKLPYENSRNFNLSRDNQKRLEIECYKYDVNNYPGAIRVDEDGFQLIDTIYIDLPENLKKSDTVIKVTFKANQDGSLDLRAEVFDNKGNKIKDGDLHLTKESDLI